MSVLLKKALRIATSAHAGQTDKAGTPYTSHPLAVADMVEGELEKTVALLHDVVEDSSITLEDLQSEFPDAVTEAIRVLTKNKGEEYPVYLARVKENPVARAVKIADMKHNSDLTRISNPQEEDILRTEKYTRGIAYLTEI